MSNLQLGLKKRVLVQTSLVEAHCQYNVETRDIVSKYISNQVTELNYDSNMNMVRERPQTFIEMCFSWYWNNISKTYKGFALSYLSDRRNSLKKLTSN